MCLETLIKVISGYHDLGILFCSLKRFGRFETVASLDAYQISVFSKTHHHFFLLPDFQRIRERDSESGILGPIAWVGMIKRFIRFFKIVPFGAPRLFIQMVQGENECLLGLPIMTTNSFENPITKNLETFFYFFALTLMIMTFIPLFRNVNKIHNDKRHPKQIYSFCANADIKVEFTFFKKCIHK